MKKLKQKPWVSPMLATLKKKPFSSKQWIFEQKFDGIRCIVVKKQDKVVLFSRNRKKLNTRFPEIVKAFEKQRAKNFTVDGEIVAFVGKLSSFEKLQGRIHLKDPTKAMKKIKVYFYAFDLLFFDKYDYLSSPVLERKKKLKSALSFTNVIRYTPHRKEKGEALLKVACQKGWEGLLGKKASSTYKTKRSSDWVKFKCANRQELIIIGYTDPKRSRIGFGALLMGYYHKRQLKYAGKIGTGFKDALLAKLSKKLKAITRSTCPVKESLIREKNVHWVKPSLVGEVSFTQWTKGGKLRHPAFLGLRLDKSAKKVIRER